MKNAVDVFNKSDTLDKVVYALQHHNESRRIKKLVFAICQNIWENSPAVLAKFELELLLQSLLERYPTLEALEAKLLDTVASLNHRQVYTTVAQTIVAQVSHLYAARPLTFRQADKATQLEVSLVTEKYEAIAQMIGRSAQRRRLTKLLYCLNYSSWENNAQILGQIDLTELVQQVHQQFPTAQALKSQLEHIIKQLNRQSEYRQVAYILLKAVQPLYHASKLISTSLDTSIGQLGQRAAPLTQLEAPIQSAVTGQTRTHQSLLRPQPATATETAQNRRNLFPLRLEILKYTNPLRAKILLQSCVYGPFSFTEPDWRSLRAKTLEDLLKETFDYCKTFADLESKLTILAHCLDGADENLRVAAAIARVMRPYYLL